MNDNILEDNYIIASDTDSVYATISCVIDELCLETDEDKLETAVYIADIFGKKINNSFPKFMAENFLVSEERGTVIQAKREVVARAGLFKNAKKRYALHILDLEGIRTNKIKTMGMETKRTDTPKYIQKFLEECIRLVIQEDKEEHDLKQYIENFRIEFRKMEPWKKGTPCGVSNITSAREAKDIYEEELEVYVNAKNKMIHYSVAAALNTNELMDIYNEKQWDYIREGDKIEILYLCKNDFNMELVAIKVGETYIPEWFKKLPFDDDRHEIKLIDKKVDNMLGILKWDLIHIDNNLESLF